jgi:hypothetical protein
MEPGRFQGRSTLQWQNVVTLLPRECRTFFRNKTGTLSRGMLYVDNHGISRPRGISERIGSFPGGPESGCKQYRGFEPFG